MARDRFPIPNDGVCLVKKRRGLAAGDLGARALGKMVCKRLKGAVQSFALETQAR